MKVVIDIPEDRYADIQRIASVQLERRWPTPEQIIAKGVTINEPRKGKWIYGESEIGHDGYYCSKCGNFVLWEYGEYDIDFIKEFLFCNKCGADMREGDAK